MKNLLTESYKKIICESSKGWNEDVEKALDEVYSNIYDLFYEVKNCIKGVYTSQYNHADLANYIRGLADDLKYAADQIEQLPDDEEDEDEEDINEEATETVDTPTDTDNIISDNKPFRNKINPNPPQYVVMVGRKYVMDDQITLTEDPDLAGKFDEDTAQDVKSNLKYKVLKVVDTNELFTDNKFDQDKANIYFKYNQIYESRQRKIKRKLI